MVGVSIPLILMVRFPCNSKCRCPKAIDPGFTQPGSPLGVLDLWRKGIRFLMRFLPMLSQYGSGASLTTQLLYRLAFHELPIGSTRSVWATLGRLAHELTSQTNCQIKIATFRACPDMSEGFSYNSWDSGSSCSSYPTKTPPAGTLDFPMVFHRCVRCPQPA